MSNKKNVAMARESSLSSKPATGTPKTLDDLFRKTNATPFVYWLPLTEEQYAARRDEHTKHENERLKSAEERRQRDQWAKSAESDEEGDEPTPALAAATATITTRETVIVTVNASISQTSTPVVGAGSVQSTYPLATANHLTPQPALTALATSHPLPLNIATDIATTLSTGHTGHTTLTSAFGAPNSDTMAIAKAPKILLTKAASVQAAVASPPPIFTLMKSQTCFTSTQLTQVNIQNMYLHAKIFFLI